MVNIAERRKFAQSNQPYVNIVAVHDFITMNRRKWFDKLYIEKTASGRLTTAVAHATRRGRIGLRGLSLLNFRLFLIGFFFLGTTLTGDLAF